MSHSALRLVVTCLVVLGCGPPGSDRDGGPPIDGVVAGASARAVIPASDLEVGDVDFGSFRIAVATLRLVSDRGPDFDPVASDVGVLDLTTENVVTFDAIPPASYSEVVIVLDGAATTLDVVATDAVLGPVHLAYHSRIDWMARCGSGVEVDVGGQLTVRIEVELGDAWEALRAADLPPPTGGVIELDESSARDVVEAFVDGLGERLSADCNDDAS